MQSWGEGHAPCTAAGRAARSSNTKSDRAPAAQVRALSRSQTPAYHTLQTLVGSHSLEWQACLHTATMWGCAHQWVVRTSRHNILTVHSCQVLPQHRYAAGIQCKQRIYAGDTQGNSYLCHRWVHKDNTTRGTIQGQHRPDIAPSSKHALQTLSIHSATALRATVLAQQSTNAVAGPCTLAKAPVSPHQTAMMTKVLNPKEINTSRTRSCMQLIARTTARC